MEALVFDGAIFVRSFAQELQKQHFLANAFALARCTVAPFLYFLEQGNLLVKKQREVHHMGRMGFVQESGKGAGIFFSPARTGDTGHDVGIEVHARFLDATDGTACPIVPVILVHELQNIVQTAFDTQVQMAHTRLGKPRELFVGLAPDSRHSRIHIDHAAAGKVFADQADYLFQMAYGKIEGVPVAQEHFLRIPSDRAHAG